jgi:hypothetical protein
MLPLIGAPRRSSIHEEISPIDVSIGSARRTSRGGSFNKDVKEGGETAPLRRSSVKVPSNVKMEPISPLLPGATRPPSAEVANREVATFFNMVRQKKLTAD